MKRVLMVAVAVTFMVGVLSSQADARRNRGPSWVPKRAWKAVERVAKQQFNTQAKLFKTVDTKSQSLGLKGTHGKAWIVGAKAPTTGQPDYHFRPYSPKQAFFLVTKGSNRRYQVTKLAGMGSYLSKVNAATDNPRVGCGVALGRPDKVGHGVEVSNASRVSVTKGTQLAAKRNGPRTNTVYVKGQANDRYGMDVTATLRASVPGSGWCGTPIPKNIPVSFSQVYFAQPMASAR
jgi:hypothetical protein